MTEIIDLNSKRPPAVYSVTIVHHYDDTLDFRVEDVADDPRSREAVMSAFRRISGADEEIEKLRTDVRYAVFADCEYAAEMDEQNAALREENARLRRLVKTAYAEGCYDSTKTEKTQEEFDALWQESFAYAAIREGGKDGN